MSKGLFDDFPPVSSKQWKQKIQFDLKGAEYNDTLVYTSNEGIPIKPFYHSEDLDNIPSYPRTQGEDFLICETIYVADATIANKVAIKSINSGATCIKFIIPNAQISLKTVLKNINQKEITIFLKPLFLSPEFVNKAINYDVKIPLDIIGILVQTGNWYINFKDDFLKFNTCIKYSNSFSIHADIYQNAGANCIQQLAYTLAHLNEYFNHIENSSFSFGQTAISVVLHTSLGSNYFFEIAKLRALRLLFETLQAEYDKNYECIIFALPTKRNKTLYDYNTNLLRTSTECMSAILGGADIINNIPYDISFRKPNAFSSRLARNQLLILKHESYFGEVQNPAEGSYYIETLTKQLAEKALVLFKDIEKNGGFLKQLKEGTIQRKIKESAAKEQTQVDDGTQTILGSNKYPNNNEYMSPEIELFPFVKTKKRKTIIEPILEKRLTESLEQQRLKKE